MKAATEQLAGKLSNDYIMKLQRLAEFGDTPETDKEHISLLSLLATVASARSLMQSQEGSDELWMEPKDGQQEQAKATQAACKAVDSMTKEKGVLLVGWALGADGEPAKVWEKFVSLSAEFKEVLGKSVDKCLQAAKRKTDALDKTLVSHSASAEDFMKTFEVAKVKPKLTQASHGVDTARRQIFLLGGDAQEVPGYKSLEEAIAKAKGQVNEFAMGTVMQQPVCKNLAKGKEIRTQLQLVRTAVAQHKLESYIRKETIEQCDEECSPCLVVSELFTLRGRLAERMRLRDSLAAPKASLPSKTPRRILHQLVSVAPRSSCCVSPFCVACWLPLPRFAVARFGRKSEAK